VAIFKKDDETPMDVLRSRLRYKRSILHRVKNDPLFGELIDILEEEFGQGRLADINNNNRTYMNLGAKEVVDYLKLINNWSDQ